MINTLIDLVPALRISDVIDVALVAVLLFFLLLALKQTRTTNLRLPAGLTFVNVVPRNVSVELGR